MTYIEFVEFIKENIRHCLPKEYADYQVVIHKITKANQEEHYGIMFQKPDEKKKKTAAAFLDLNVFFELLQEGTFSCEQVLQQICENYFETEQSSMDDFAQTLLQWEKVKHFVTFHLINLERNYMQLEGTQYDAVEDLALHYCVEVMQSPDCIATILIGDQLMDHWGISKEQLRETAFANAIQKHPPCLMLEGQVSLDARKDECIPAYSLKAGFTENGSIAIVYPGLLEAIRRNLGVELYIVPVSTEEVILSPKVHGISPETVQAACRALRPEPEPECFLSDNIYECTAESSLFKIAKQPHIRGRRKLS